MRSNRHWIAFLLLLAGCATTPRDGMQFGATDGSAGGPEGPEPESTTMPAGSGSSTGADETTGSDDGSEGEIFDVAGPGGEPDNGVIPRTCERAEDGDSTVGCLFYAVDLDNNSTSDTDQYAVVVSNVQEDVSVGVTIEVREAGGWTEVASSSIGALDLQVFELPHRGLNGSGVAAGGAYRITTTEPAIVYQFNPFGSQATTDASLLYPASSWDTLNHVVHWGEGSDGNTGRGYATIVAQKDGTQVELTPSVATASGPGVPAGSAGSPIAIALDEGDVAEVMVSSLNAALTGSRIESNHPIGVFGGHECGNVPYGVGTCDHLEEQLAGLHFWGMHFVAARVPVRRLEQPEPSLWQIYASEDGTTVTFDAAAGVAGLPGSPQMMDAGDAIEVLVDGEANEPGDFAVNADKPITVLNYVAGRSINTGEAAQWGDPAMVQHAPVEQFLTRYVVLVPPGWDYDHLVLTRAAGAEVLVDDVGVADAEFSAVGPDHEVARISVEDGVHRLSSDEPFGVVVVGYDFADSYGYLGGAGTAPINPNPAG